MPDIDTLALAIRYALTHKPIGREGVAERWVAAKGGPLRR
jgi:hypothetical protein